ncbi:substrate-binding domain-containing protein [Magnetococcus sp. PR-3]|uniref:substrate-binding domain-containing protein n=1 Tax=Magnetococcus sp. PR-3 TaxID=3120355 RepID=UPI002FCE2B0F
MKTRYTLNLFIFLLLLGLWVTPTASAQSQQFLVGFSQATTTEPWRLLFNKLLREEAERHPQLRLLVRNAQDDIQKQIKDVQEFIKRDVDIILISPKVSTALTPVVNQAHKLGIPTIVLDRDLDNDHYTQFIGGDNLEIGRAAGRFVVKQLGGPGEAQGHIVEIWGGIKSTPAHDRHNGFFEIISQEPGIRILNPMQDGDWKQDQGYEIMVEALEKHAKIDIVYAHNDPMAFGAYLAAKDIGRERQIAFIGIDGIPQEGVRWVHQGIMKATFLYQTPGEEAIRQAIKLLNGNAIPKRVTLPTYAITKHNAEDILKKHGLLK